MNLSEALNSWRLWIAEAKSRVAPGFLAMLLAMSLATGGLQAAEKPVTEVFTGTSPCEGAIRQLLDISNETSADIIQWTLTLNRDPATLAPSNYDLRYDYGPAASGRPGMGSGAQTVTLTGAWTIDAGADAKPGAEVYELSGALSLARINADILHILNPDSSLMIGNGGWSYTLNRQAQAEATVDLALILSAPDMSYPVPAPLAKGPDVYGIFEGRTPCHGIAGELALEVHAGCSKAKWRLTLYQDPETKEPAAYRIEGTLFRAGAREGTWSLVHGTPDSPDAVIYRLEAATDDAALLLLQGDENVLFLLGQSQTLLVGNRDYSYTVNRRAG